MEKVVKDLMKLFPAKKGWKFVGYDTMEEEFTELNRSLLPVGNWKGAVPQVKELYKTLQTVWGISVDSLTYAIKDEEITPFCFVSREVEVEGSITILNRILDTTKK